MTAAFAILASGGPAIDQADSQTPDDWIAALTDVHHPCIREHVRRLDQLGSAEGDGEREDGGSCGRDADPQDPVLVEIRQLVQGLAACVEMQLEKEERVLFPTLARLRHQTRISRCHAGMVRSLVATSERDMARVRGVLARLNDLLEERLAFAPDCRRCRLMDAVAEAMSMALAGHDELETLLFEWAVSHEGELAR